MDKFTEEVSLSSKDFPKIIENSLVLSENETICSSYSFMEEFSKVYEQELDNMLEKYANQDKDYFTEAKKKRGRKPLRPNDPIRKKTEIKDKYWLRAFRNFVKIHFSTIKELFSDKQLKFWLYYISKTGKPGKNSEFLSYGKSYKRFLFEETTFLDFFTAWFIEFGQIELSKRYERGSDLWFIYYDYALKEIADKGKKIKIYQDFFNNRVKIQDSAESIDCFFIN